MQHSRFRLGPQTRGRVVAVWWSAIVLCGWAAACDPEEPSPALDAGDSKDEGPRPFGGLLGPTLCAAGGGDVMECRPGCLELCNGRDDDCDGIVDEGSPNPICFSAYAESTCADARCVIVNCLGGRRDCDQQFNNGCEIARDDPNHCEACGVPCSIPHATSECLGARCRVVTCEPGWADCDGDGISCESSLDTADHCGACDARCGSLANAEARCDAGRCVPALCEPSFGDCDGLPENGCEQPLDSLSHCGACGDVCDRAACSGGVCSSLDCREMTGLADCDGDGQSCEADLRTDENNCGSCGHACMYSSMEPHAVSSCVDGKCKIACEPSWAECDGSFANGCETALDSIDNCGDCGKVCGIANAMQSCVAGQCRMDGCKADYADCDGDPANGCERDTRPPSLGGTGPCLPDQRCEREAAVGSEYYFCSTSRSWQEARLLCQSQQFGDLAQVPDVETRDFFRRRLRVRSWIGHNDLMREGLWVWSHNAVPFWRATAAGGVPVADRYADWSSGEPNASGDCGAIYETGLLDDLTCTRPQPFVCQRFVDACPDDPNKFDPGQCGCGQRDSDADQDGFADCVDPNP